MISWMKDSGAFKLVTKVGSLYEVNHSDRLYRSLFVGQLDLFVFSINPKVKMLEQKKTVNLDISIIPISGKKVTYSKTVEVNKEFVFENLFQVPGEYKVVISSYFLSNKLEYVVKVFDGDNLLRPLSGFGEFSSEVDGATIPLSVEVIYRITKEKVVNDFIIWELIEKPLGAFVDFQRRSTTNSKGIAENSVVCSPVKGKYVIRARRLFAPEEYFDFVFITK